MLTIRSFRNEDPPRLLKLWQKTQQRGNDPKAAVPLSMNLLQAQMLGLPMLDNRSIMLAFEDDIPVGYVHTSFAPTADGYSFDYTTGHICFLCVYPECSDAFGTAAALIRAGEDYLLGLGAQKIFGGSPSPSAPFYTGFYSGAESVGILLSDKKIAQAFYEANYQVHQKTAWFCFDFHSPLPPLFAEVAKYHDKFDVEISEVPRAKTWWEGCTQTNGIWFDAVAYPARTERPVARLRTRIAYPDTENILMMYGGIWLASLMELRVHPDFADGGVAKYLLVELIRYLAAQNQVFQIETHAAEDSPLFILLCGDQRWQKQDDGCVFVKTLKGCVQV
jgi:ribosomal protein S18 acetylase RimI-like enzyme